MSSSDRQYSFGEPYRTNNRQIGKITPTPMHRAAIRGERLCRNAKNTPIEDVTTIPKPMSRTIMLKATECPALGFRPGRTEFVCGFESSCSAE
jgi:hypothetical protein